jgi:endonuclease G
MKTDFFSVLNRSGDQFSDAFVDYFKNQVVNQENLAKLYQKGLLWSKANLPSLISELNDKKVFNLKIANALPQENVRDDLFKEGYVSERNNILDVHYLERGIRCAKAVCRVNVKDDSSVIETGTGFLIKGGYLVTNYHVLCIQETDYTEFSNIEFNVQYDIDGNAAETTRFALEPQTFKHFSEDNDLAIVKVSEVDSKQKTQLSDFGYLNISRNNDDASVKYLSIIQHPEGDYKKIALRENHVVPFSQVQPYLKADSRVEHLLWYATNTTNGASGSPVFNDKWQLVAVHHSGIPIKKGDTYECIDGEFRTEAELVMIKNFKDLLRFKANEGIRAKCLLDLLTQLNIPL